MYTRLLAVLTILLLISCKNSTTPAKEMSANSKKENLQTMFVGTYTKKEGHVDGQARGITALKLNSETGAIVSQKTVAEVVNPSFVKASSNGNFLFAVSELGSSDAPSGYFYSFRILDNDSLQQISKISTEAFAPAHIALDKTGKYAFVSNYLGGVVMVYSIDQNGALQKQQRVDLKNPEGAHAHSVTLSPDNKTAYVADLGNDKIWIYDFNSEKGLLTVHQQESISLEKGSGPRHFTIAKDGKTAYSINELSSTVTAYKISANGSLDILQTISTLPSDYTGKNYTADIHLHPSGKFLFASNRGHNSIVAFEVDGSGKLFPFNHFSTQGSTPRNFTISPSGEYLYVANQDSNNVVLFEVDLNSKDLLSGSRSYEVMTPVCLEIL